MSKYIAGKGLYGYASSTGGKTFGDFLKNAKVYHRAGTTGRPDLMLNDWIRMAPMLLPQYLEQTPEAQMLFSGEGYEQMVMPQIRSMLTGIRTTARGSRAALAARGLGRSSLAASLGAEAQMRGTEGVAALLAQARQARFQQAVGLRQSIAQLQAALTTGVMPAMHRKRPKKGSFWKNLARGALSTAVGSGIGAGVGALFGAPLNFNVGLPQGWGAYGGGKNGIYGSGPGTYTGYGQYFD